MSLYLYTCIVVNLYKLCYKPSIRRRSDSDTGFFSEISSKCLNGDFHHRLLFGLRRQFQLVTQFDWKVKRNGSRDRPRCGGAMLLLSCLAMGAAACSAPNNCSF